MHVSMLVSKKISAADAFMELLNSLSMPYLTGFLRLNNTKIESKRKKSGNRKLPIK